MSSLLEVNGESQHDDTVQKIVIELDALLPEEVCQWEKWRNEVDGRDQQQWRAFNCLKVAVLHNQHSSQVMNTRMARLPW